MIDFDEAAGEQWLFLLPKKWNPTTQKQVYCWRYDPRELVAARAPDERRRNMRRATEDVAACTTTGRHPTRARATGAPHWGSLKI